jgi:hypothetical protein
MQLKRRSNMAIYPKIETRRVNRRNGTAYQHRRRRSLTGGLSVITHGRRMEYERSHSMFLTHSIARLTTKSWSDRASLPRKRARSAHVQKRERVLKDSEGIELTPYRPARFCQHLSVRTQLVLCLREHSLYTISFEKIEPTLKDADFTPLSSIVLCKLFKTKLFDTGQNVSGFARPPFLYCFM